MIGPITDKILTNLSSEIKKDKNKEIITINLIDPLICNIKEKIYPYIFLFFILQIIIILLLVIIVFKNNKTYINKQESDK